MERLSQVYARRGRPSMYFLWSVSSLSQQCMTRNIRLQLTGAEFCYTLRYVIQNKRSSGPAWSVRRTAVYQQYYFEKRISKWILLQPPANSQKILSEAQAQRKEGGQQHPMRDQVVLLYSTATFWGEYIMDLRKDLEKLVWFLLWKPIQG